MQVLFIDQNKWIDLARAASGSSEGKKYVEVYRSLVLAMESGRIILPLTNSHIIETAKRNDPESRIQVAKIQAQLSKGFVYRSRKARLLMEMRNSLHKIFSEPVAELPVNWAIASGFMQAFESTDTLVATSEEASRTRLIDLHFDPESLYLNFMGDQDDEMRRAGIAAFTAESTLILQKIEARRAVMTGASVDLRYRAYSAMLFLDHQGYVAQMLGAIGHSVEEMKALGGEAVLAFMQGVPTLNVEAEIAARLEIQTGELDSNDLRDMQNFYTAIPYSSRLIAEKGFISLSRQAKLGTKYGVELHTNLNDLMPTFE